MPSPTWDQVTQTWDQTTDTWDGLTQGGGTSRTPGTLASISPSTGIQGNAYNVAARGTGTNFDLGCAVTVSGSGVFISNIVSLDALTLTFDVSIQPGAATTARTITITDSIETLTGTFTVLTSAGGGATSSGTWVLFFCGGS